MDNQKVGGVIKKLRTEKGITQKQLADILNISDKTVSKWECGAGAPDVSFLPELSALFKTDIEQLLKGELTENTVSSGNIKKTGFFYCEKCGSISAVTGESAVSCCGRRLKRLSPQKAEDSEKMDVTDSEDDWYITSSHDMKKENYISFAVFLTGDKMTLFKFYPEWNLSFRIKKREHGTLLWHSQSDGLKYQYI